MSRINCPQGVAPLSPPLPPTFSVCRSNHLISLQSALSRSEPNETGANQEIVQIGRISKKKCNQGNNSTRIFESRHCARMVRKLISPFFPYHIGRFPRRLCARGYLFFPWDCCRPKRSSDGGSTCLLDIKWIPFSWPKSETFSLIRHKSEWKVSGRWLTVITPRTFSRTRRDVSHDNSPLTKKSRDYGT